MKNVLILSATPRVKGNSQLICESFSRGATEAGHCVNLVRLSDKNIHFCRACDACMKNGGTCVIKDDMRELLALFQKADVLVLSTPIYFYGITAQMKTFIDRTYPIWQNLGHKDVYYIISAGLDKKVIDRSLGDLDGFVEHLESSEIKGRLYAENVMDTGMVQEMPILEEAYQMGKRI